MNTMGESIQDNWDKFKSFCGQILAEERLFLGILIVSLTVTAFGLGRLAEQSALPAEPIVSSASVVFTEASPLAPEEAALNEVPSEDEQYVASKSGTKYHYPWCPGAKQIKEENKIYFDSKPAAEAAGYTPAANCQGL